MELEYFILSLECRSSDIMHAGTSTIISGTFYFVYSMAQSEICVENQFIWAPTGYDNTLNE